MNFNILYKHSQAFPLQENNNNNVKKPITQNDIYNTVNIDSFFVSRNCDSDNEQNEQICNETFNS